LTPLHAALGGNFSECAVILIARGAIGSTRDAAGHTPFAVARLQFQILIFFEKVLNVRLLFICSLCFW